MSSIAEQVRAVPHAAGACRAFVLPTTRATVDYALSQTDAGVVVVAPWLGERHALATCLGQLGGAHGALVFSDQLTAPLDAPWCVEWDGTARYLPVVEAAAQRAGFEVHAWTGSGFSTAPPEHGPLGIARLLRAYLAACESLGDTWLARDAQVERLRRVRAYQADQRLRLLQSAVLHASDGDRPAPVAMQVLRRAKALQQDLRASLPG